MPSQRDLDRLATLLASVSKDPYQFVMLCFPWAVPGSELENHAGPDVWQEKVLKEIRDGLRMPDEIIREAVASGHGVGKAQPNNLEIDTPAGRRRWGDLQVGDFVFGRNGHPTRVAAIHERGTLETYRVSFDDRSSTVVCGDHLWNVRGINRDNGERQRDEHFRTLSTLDLLKLGVRRQDGGKYKPRVWELPRIEPVSYPFRWVPMEPYTLGVWLGDGARRTSTFTSADPEVSEAIVRNGGATLDPRPTRSKASVFTIERGGWALRELGLFECNAWEKSIPTVYMENIPEIRAAVLRGLFDSDGFVTPTGSIVFGSTSERLTRDVAWLARSLGGKAGLHVAKATGYKTLAGDQIAGRPFYNVTVTMPDGFKCCEISRKQVRIRKSTEARYLCRWLDSIEPAGMENCRCITVEAEDGLYLTNDFIPTHNSALVSWLILWALSTMSDTLGVVTANTETQLKTKTWAQLAKWHRMFIGEHMFVITATSIYSSDPKHQFTWRIDAVPWSEKNPQAFAGLHNQDKRILLIFDEAADIADIIWETAEGALTDKNTEIIWGVFGNPSHNNGRFRGCYGRYSHRWKHHHVDGRNARMSNKKLYDEWAADRGVDSDFFKIRVLGQFPDAGAGQFISMRLVEDAASSERDIQPTVYDPLIMGVDCARSGPDSSIIRYRRGRDARSISPIKYRGADTMEFAAIIVSEYELHRPDVVFIDGGGPGGPIIDRVRQFNVPVVEVVFGARALPGRGLEVYYNLRAQMWGLMRDWLKTGMIDNDLDLIEGLTAIEYDHKQREGIDALLLEQKADMRSRGLPSPDDADALACTFCMPVQPKDHTSILTSRARSSHESEYSPFAEAWKVGQPRNQSPSGGTWTPHGDRWVRPGYGQR